MPAIFISGEIRFAVRLTPRGRRDAIDGWGKASDGSAHLKVRVSAPPESGKANAALLALLAHALGIAKSQISIVSGEKARLKVIVARGDTSALKAKLQALGDAT